MDTSYKLCWKKPVGFQAPKETHQERTLHLLPGSPPPPRAHPCSPESPARRRRADPKLPARLCLSHGNPSGGFPNRTCHRSAHRLKQEQRGLGVRSQESPAPWPAHPAGRQDTSETHRGLTFSPLVNTSKSSQCSFKWGRRRFSNFSSFPPLAN